MSSSSKQVSKKNRKQESKESKKNSKPKLTAEQKQKIKNEKVKAVVGDMAVKIYKLFQESGAEINTDDDGLFDNLLILLTNGIKSVTKSVKSARDPNAPKRAPTGYQLFCADNREKVTEKLGKGHNSEVLSELGRLWKKSEKVQAKYNAKALPLKEKYKQEYEVYVKSDSYKQHAMAKARHNALTYNPKNKTRPVKPKDLDAPARPASAYSLFRKLIEIPDDLSPPEVMTYVAKVWRASKMIHDEKDLSEDFDDEKDADAAAYIEDLDKKQKKKLSKLYAKAVEQAAEQKQAYKDAMENYSPPDWYADALEKYKENLELWKENHPDKIKERKPREKKKSGKSKASKGGPPKNAYAFFLQENAKLGAKKLSKDEYVWKEIKPEWEEKFGKWKKQNGVKDAPKKKVVRESKSKGKSKKEDSDDEEVPKKKGKGKKETPKKSKKEDSDDEEEDEEENKQTTYTNEELFGDSDDDDDDDDDESTPPKATLKKLRRKSPEVIEEDTEEGSDDEDDEDDAPPVKAKGKVKATPKKSKVTPKKMVSKAAAKLKAAKEEDSDDELSDDE